MTLTKVQTISVRKFIIEIGAFFCVFLNSSILEWEIIPVKENVLKSIENKLIGILLI